MEKLKFLKEQHQHGSHALRNVRIPNGKIKVLRIASFAAPALHVEGSTCADAYGQKLSLFQLENVTIATTSPASASTRGTQSPRQSVARTFPVKHVHFLGENNGFEHRRTNARQC